jgi:hypothetical protein
MTETDDMEQVKRAAVVVEARRYRSAMRRWEVGSRANPAEAVKLWREVTAAERALFELLDALDESGDLRSLSGVIT